MSLMNIADDAESAHWNFLLAWISGCGNDD